MRIVVVGAEYDPRMFHLDQPHETRLRIFTEMWNGWETDDRRGPIRQLKRHVKTEVDQTFGYVISEGQRLKMSTPLCRAIATIIYQIEEGKRPLQLDNYGELIRTLDQE
jgi:2-dehydropantoate 2-reductase